MNQEDTDERTVTETVLVFIMCHSRKSLGNTQVKLRFHISVVNQQLNETDKERTYSGPTFQVKTSLNFVDIHSDENLTVHEISHMRRSSSIQSLNSDFVDAASDDSFQKEVPRSIFFIKKVNEPLLISIHINIITRLLKVAWDTSIL